MIDNYRWLFCLILGTGILLSTLFSPSLSFEDMAFDNSKVTITASYSNDTSKTYTILTNVHQKYTISQSYSWKNNNYSRFNLQAYSIDNGPKITIPRLPEGNFTLEIPTDSNHHIVFVASQQFKVVLTGTNQTIFSPPSPTNDSWFDANSDLQIIVPHSTPTDQDNVRQQLSGWSSDDSYTNVVTRNDSGSFKLPVIHLLESHKINLEYKTQYYVRVFSNFGRPVGNGWYDSGTIVNVSVVPGNDLLVRYVFQGWQGPIIGYGDENSANLFVDSPKTVVAIWYADYNLVSIIGVSIIAVVVTFIIYKKRKNR